MIGRSLFVVVLSALVALPVGAGERFRPVDDFDAAMREVWPAGMSPTGSGFIVASGLVLSAAHVVAGCRLMWVRAPGVSRVPAAILGIDTRVDAVLLRVGGLRGLPSAHPARIVPGETVLMLGYPKRKGKVMEEPIGIAKVVGDLVYDEVVGPLLELVGRGREGVSGGPVLDRTGRVVGMVVASRRGEEDRVLAIPSERLAEFLAYMNVDWGGNERPDLSSHGAGELPQPKPRPGVLGQSTAVVFDVLQVGCSK